MGGKSSKNADVILDTGCGSHFRNPAFFRIVKITKTNCTSEERSDTQLFRNVMFKGVALSGGHHAHLQYKKTFLPHVHLCFLAINFGKVDMQPS